MKKAILIASAAFLVAAESMAFCGFYVAKAGATLFNEKSQVILVRDGDRMTVTMSNDFKGNVRDFAMVVPVPQVLRRNDIKVLSPSLFSKLDEYSSPRMVEYYDNNPCMNGGYFSFNNVDMNVESLNEVSISSVMKRSANEYKVTIEAQYEVDEYDVLILSAKESTGLKRWLIENKYKIPESADEVLDPYIKNGLKFFVVKVNLDRMTQPMTDYLRPLQISYTSDRFMLPIRLGMANATGPQDMIVYAFTKQGRIECTNYRTVELPTDRNIPKFVKDKGKFGAFYKDLFEKAYEREGRNAVFLEYAWDVTPNVGVKCDPCVGPPPMYQEFADAGVDWLTMSGAWNQGGQGAHFTRLHVRYTRDEFPQDLQFQVTPNKQRYQTRYVITNPATGDLSCEGGQKYLKDLEWRRKREVDELAALTGWKAPRYAAYIYEFSDRIQDESNNGVFPMLPHGGGGGPWYMMTLSILAISAVGWYLSKQTKRASQWSNT